jgi:hypothetical protein
MQIQWRNFTSFIPCASGLWNDAVAWYSTPISRIPWTWRQYALLKCCNSPTGLQQCDYPDHNMHLHHHQNLKSYSVTSNILTSQLCHLFSFWPVKNLAKMADLLCMWGSKGRISVLFCLPTHYRCLSTRHSFLAFCLKISLAKTKRQTTTTKN